MKPEQQLLLPILFGSETVSVCQIEMSQGKYAINQWCRYKWNTPIHSLLILIFILKIQLVKKNVEPIFPKYLSISSLQIMTLILTGHEDETNILLRQNEHQRVEFSFPEMQHTSDPNLWNWKPASLYGTLRICGVSESSYLYAKKSYFHLFWEANSFERTCRDHPHFTFWFLFVSYPAPTKRG